MFHSKYGQGTRGFSLLIASEPRKQCDSWRINIANVETKCSQWLPEGCGAPLGCFEEYFGALRGALSHKIYIRVPGFSVLSCFHCNHILKIHILRFYKKTHLKPHLLYRSDLLLEGVTVKAKGRVKLKKTGNKRDGRGGP